MGTGICGYPCPYFSETNIPGLLPDVDPDGLLEYSVVYTDRALNHMSAVFQGVMKDLTRTLRQVYGAQAAVVVPGSGTFGMEAVARQLSLEPNFSGWLYSCRRNRTQGPACGCRAASALSAASY